MAVLFGQIRTWILFLTMSPIYPLVLFIAFVNMIRNAIMGRQKKDKSIAGEVAVITGAARGLGKCIAVKLAAKGCHVAIVDVQIELAEEAAKEIREKYNVKAKAYKVDVTNYDELEALNEKVKQDIGLATILINNAGILKHAKLADPQVKEVHQMIAVNYTSHFLTLRVFMENMKQAHKGHIVAICSVAGLLPLLYSEPYCSTKFAVRTLMRILRAELRYERRQYIHATTIFPTFLETNQDVAKLATSIGYGLFYPLKSGEEVAERTVRAIMRNEEEVAVPMLFAWVARLFDLLPSYMQSWFIVEPLYYMNIGLHRLLGPRRQKSVEN